MFKKMLVLGVLCFFAVLACGTAKADTLGPSCSSCLGSSYTLTDSATSNPDQFDVFLTVDTSGFTGSKSDTLNAVSLKLVSQSSEITSVSLVSAPAGFSSTEDSGLSSGGCSGSGSGFFCSESKGNGLAVGGNGDDYTFEWLVTVSSPSDLLTGLDADSLKALYLTSRGGSAGITSNDISLTQETQLSSVPEPSSLLLLGSGVAGLAGVIKRRYLGTVAA